MIVEDIFWRLPVRRRELQRTGKAQVSALLQLLTAYALIQNHVRFIFITQSKRNPYVKETVQALHLLRRCVYFNSIYAACVLSVYRKRYYAQKVAAGKRFENPFSVFLEQVWRKSCLM